MATLDLSTIISNMNLDERQKSFFDNVKIDKVKLYSHANRVNIYLSSENIIPFEIYTSLRLYLKTLLKTEVKIIVNAKDASVKLTDLQRYIRDFIANDTLGYYFKNADATYAHKNLDLLFQNEELMNKANSAINHLSDYLNDIGLSDVTINTSFEAVKDTTPTSVTLPPSLSNVDKQDNYVEKPKYKTRKISRDNYVKVQLADIQNECDNIQFEAEVFRVVYKETKTGTTIQTVSLCDDFDAINMVRFTSAKLPLEALQEIQEGDYVKVYGSVVYSKFDNELNVRAYDIQKIEKPQIVDNEKNKRVELHAHSNISEMDGVCETVEFVEQAIKFGHKAFAITDHMAVQSFPKAQRYLEQKKKKNKDLDFKMIYGVEMNMVDDKLQIVHGSNDLKLDEQEYVVFDLETTGLSSYYDHVIEFGAVKVKNNTVIEHKQMFIKPPVSIPPFIQSKTNITNNDVKDALPFDKAVDELLAFIGDDVLVAHNAKFDVGFFNEELKRINRPQLTNTFIDTLDLARAIHSDRRQYRLGNIARLYRITYDEEIAHRADYDADVLANVFLSMLSKAKELGAITINDLQTLQADNAFVKVRASHICVLAKNQQGIKNIYKLVSISNTDTLAVFGKANSKSSGEEFLAEPRIFREAINKYRDDLLIGSACLNSEVFELAANGSQEKLEKAISFYDYIEVQPCENYRQLIELNSVPSMERLQQVLKRIIDTAIKLKKTVVATGDAHYVLPSEKIYRDIYIQTQGIGGVRHPLYIYNAEKRRSFVNPNQHFRTTKEMLDAFAFLDDNQLVEDIVINNTNKIADMIEETQPVPNKLYPPKIKDSDERLKDICYKTAHEKYGEKLPDVVEKRLEKELNSIIKHGYSVIYYISHLLVKQSNEDGYLVGSRGSVGSSFVATMSGITEVNPLAPHYLCKKCKHIEWIDDGSVASGYDLQPKVCPVCGEPMIGDGQNIPFETFLGFEGDKVPDIDLNFSGEYQDKAHAFTKTVFGDDHVFRAGTIGTVADKTAFGYVTGYAEEMGIENMRPVQKDRLALGCTGVKRTTGQHPGGIIVIPQDMDVTDFTPYQYPANDPKSEWLTTHYDFHDIHDNVLKFDILGHVDPTAMRLLQNISGIDPRTIPMNDEEVMSLFYSDKALKADPKIYKEETGALGLPEFGTRTTRRVLEETRPKTFSDLLIISGLSHGTDVWAGNAEVLVQNGIPLNEVIGCRDDIMTYLLQKGLQPKTAFTIMESVRKGKGLIDDWITDMKAHDVPDWYIDSCKKIKYMFPKAHAVAYVIMAVRIAWFKVHYPHYYYISYFSLRCDAYEIETMTKGFDQIKLRSDELWKRMNNPETKNQVTKRERDIYNTLEVCLELYARGYRIEPINLYDSHATTFTVKEGDNKTIIPPFITIDGLGENVAKSIEEARKQGPFISKEDLASRTQLSTTLIRKLETLGALEGLQEKNQMSLF